jgi:hypothetical protein
MISAIQIIDETIKHYTSGNPRAVIDDDFFYSVKLNNKRVALDPVCRCMYKKYQGPEKNLEYKTIEEISKEHNGFDNILKNKYAGHPLIFWKDLQSLHDQPEYWEENSKKPKLTPLGENRIKFLKKFYTLGAAHTNKTAVA